MCKNVVPDNIHTPNREHSGLSPPPHNFHSRGCFSYTPHPGISINLVESPPEKNTCMHFSQNAVALYIHARDNCFCGKETKNLNPVNTGSNDLSFAL